MLTVVVSFTQLWIRSVLATTDNWSQLMRQFSLIDKPAAMDFLASSDAFFLTTSLAQNMKQLWECRAKVTFWYVVPQEHYKYTYSNILNKLSLTNSSSFLRRVPWGTFQVSGISCSDYWRLCLQFHSCIKSEPPTDSCPALPNALHS